MKSSLCRHGQRVPGPQPFSVGRYDNMLGIIFAAKGVQEERRNAHQDDIHSGHKVPIDANQPTTR